MKTETKYNKIVNYNQETKEITVLDYTFKHSDDFKGATGTTFKPISKAYYKDRMKKDNVIESLLDCEHLPEEFQRGGYNSLYKAMKANNEIEDFVFDCSYRELWDEIHKELKLSKDEAYIFNCSGGGRCFDKDFQGNINPELSEIIREYESE